VEPGAPRLPSPHQVGAEIHRSVFTVSPTSNRSLLYHAWVTLSSTLLGFVIGTLLGICSPS
jgi:NitT/TauT family transport system permease protein